MMDRQKIVVRIPISKFFGHAAVKVVLAILGLVGGIAFIFWNLTSAYALAASTSLPSLFSEFVSFVGAIFGLLVAGFSAWYLRREVGKRISFEF